MAQLPNSAGRKPLPKLEQIRSAHVIGVCGTLMGAFAAYLKRRGMTVTGSDQNVYPPMSDVLKNAGVELFSGYRPENLAGMKSKPDLVVIGNVITAANPEAREAIEGGYAYCSLPEAMEALLLESTRNLVVAGTHGKTTTSSMLAHALSRTGRDPSYFIGGVSRDLPFSFNVSEKEAAGKPRYFVLEGDEYDTAFWDKVPKFNHYLPDDVILTSVEYDHADIYPDFASVVRAFEGLLERIRPGGRLIACLDFAAVRELVKEPGRATLLTYASAPGTGARFAPERIRQEGEWVKFDVVDSGKKVEEIALVVPGEHNVMNALAAWIECRELGIPSAEVAAALREFKGVKRRQESRGEIGGILVIDDFAHHPTAVRETLRALKRRYPGRRIVAVFEPRSATSRRKVFQRDYVEAFREAEAAFVATPYDQTKIAAVDQFSSDQLVADLESKGIFARIIPGPGPGPGPGSGSGPGAGPGPGVEPGVAEVSKFARSGDVVAVLSNGGFGGFIPKLLEALSSR